MQLFQIRIGHSEGIWVLLPLFFVALRETQS